jgi:putative hydrolase of the HAD superfamily
MIKAVLFDLDGTLWDRDGAVQQLVAAQYRAHPALANISRDQFVERVLTLDAHGLGDKRDVYRQVVH